VLKRNGLLENFKAINISSEIVVLLMKFFWLPKDLLGEFRSWSFAVLNDFELCVIWMAALRQKAEVHQIERVISALGQ
jgi:hypothetical protein